MAELTLDSQPGSFIGGGQNWDITYTPTNSDNFTASVQQTVSGSPSDIVFIMGTVSISDNTFAILEFSTAELGLPITPGTYDDAQRAAFAAPGHPGLDVSFQNRGSNVLTGSFVVTDAVFSGDTIDAFTATFTQDSDSNSSEISGSFTYSANASVPEPLTLSLFGAGLAGAAAMRRRKAKQ